MPSYGRQDLGVTGRALSVRIRPNGENISTRGRSDRKIAFLRARPLFRPVPPASPYFPRDLAFVFAHDGDVLAAFDFREFIFVFRVEVARHLMLPVPVLLV